MSARNLAIVAAAIVVLLLAIALGQRSGSPVAGTGTLFVPDLNNELPNVESVTISTGGNKVVAAFERGSDTWTVSNKGGYAANVAKLRQGLQALGEARILEQKTSNPEFYSQLGVEDTAGADAAGVGVSLKAGDKEIAAVILGNAQGSKYRYVRRAGEAQSYLIDRNPDFPRAVAQWLDALIIDLRSDRVKRVTITHPDGEVVTVSKASADAQNYDVANVPKGRELLYPGVANVIGNALRELNLEDVERASAAADGEGEGDEKPTVVEFRTFDGLVVRAEGTKRGDEHWLTFEASVDPETPPPASPPAAESTGSTEPAEPAPAADATQPPADPKAEAERINARVGGWRYRIASFQYDQMTRRMTDLLKPPA
jgi:Domain of unknown function (DUF4340)